MLSPMTLRLFLFACLMSTAAGCGSSSAPTIASPTPVAATAAQIALSVTPSPVTATICNPKCAGTSGTLFDFSVSLTLTVRENAGLGGNIDGVDWIATKGSLASSPLVISPALIGQSAGTNHVAARSSLSVPLTVVYSTADGSKDRTVTLTVHFTDDKGNIFTPTIQVNVL